MSFASIVLILNIAGQQVERVDDPQLRATGRQAVLNVGSLWNKIDGRWIESAGGSRRIPFKYQGKATTKRLFNIRIKATGFAEGSQRYAVVSLLHYDDLKVPGQESWLLELSSYMQLVFVVTGPFSPQPEPGNASMWNIPLVGAWTGTSETFLEYWKAQEGNTWVASDVYAMKSFAATFPSLKVSLKAPQQLSWPIWRVVTKSGPVVRFMLPVESGIDIGQDWGKMYFETTPRAWSEFTQQLSKMVE